VLHDLKVNEGGFSQEHFSRSHDIMLAEFNRSSYVLDEWLLTLGKWDLKEGNWDGLHFEGVARRMASVILLNILCNTT
jgi:hypothetical protein